MAGQNDDRGLKPDHGRIEEADQHEGRKRDRARLRRLVQATILVLILVGAAVWVALRVTERPGFYRIFPWLSSYTSSWERSGHAEVPCAECHFPPGAGGSAHREAVSVSLIVDKLTGVESTSAFRFPGNRSCVRKGCHADILGEKGEVRWKGIRFSHRSHLSQLKRGISLACTTCHQQLVHGTEKPVDASSCITCHFKGLKWEEDISRCTLCHDMATAPKGRFDHSKVVARKMDCRGCHADLSKGTGDVDRERCVACHPSGDHGAHFGDPKLIHEQHVTKLGFGCTFCHHPIEHRVHPMTITDDTSCIDCHRSAHEAERALYMGVNSAIPTVESKPAPMYNVHVHCLGCHSTWRRGRDGEVRKPSAKACNGCHGPGYDRILRQWSTLLRRDFAVARRAVGGAASTLKGHRLSKKAAGALKEARARLEQVKQGHGEHNIVFAVTQLDEAVAAANRALKDAGVGTTYARIADAKKLTANECARCHLELPQTVRYKGGAFPHERHVKEVGDCESCHTPYSDHGKLSWGKEACANCHSSAVPIPHPKGFRSQMGRYAKKAGFDVCLQCHDTPEARERCTPCHLGGPKKEIQWQGMAVSHENHARHDIECTTCHTELDKHGGVALTPDDCNDCHGLPMPHPDDFAETHGRLFEEGKLELDTCSTCHEGGMPGEFCQTCHG